MRSRKVNIAKEKKLADLKGGGGGGGGGYYPYLVRLLFLLVRFHKTNAGRTLQVT